MQQKLLSFKFFASLLGLALVGLVALGIFNTSSASGLDDNYDFKLHIQMSNNGGWGYFGTPQSIPFLSSASTDSLTEDGISKWATDATGHDPDAGRLRIEHNGNTTDFREDFRVCIQVGDNYVNGQAETLMGLACTPWAGDGGGWSGVAYDADLYDFDAMRIRIQQRGQELPADTTVADVRFGLQLGDEGCSAEFGDPQYTPWLSHAANYPNVEHWSAWAGDENYIDPDCARIRMEVELEFADQNDAAGNPNNLTPLSCPAGESEVIELGSSEVSVTDTDHEGRPIAGTLRCPAGEIVTGMAYKDGLTDDAVDGITIACSPLSSDGSLGAQGNYLANADIDSSPRRLVSFACPANYAYIAGASKDYAFTRSNSDILDGITNACSRVSMSGTGPLREPYIHVDILQNRDLFLQRCPANHVVVGVSYDEFGSSLPGNGDATDAIASVICKPLVLSCEASEPVCSDGIDNDGDGFADYPADDGCSDADDTSEADDSVPACSNNTDDDGDGYTDLDDPGCENANDNDESDSISCTLTANPTSLVKGIGTSELTWSCLHTDGTAMNGVVSIVEDNSAQDFAGIGANLDTTGSVNVAPEQTTRFTLSPSIVGVAPVTTTIRVEESSFDEDIP